MAEVKFGELIVMTNSVLGLSILTMPFCFQQVYLMFFSGFFNLIIIISYLLQCGLILGTLSLVTSALMTSYSCKLLVSLINMKKTKTFEFLALRIFGHKAKLLLEIRYLYILYNLFDFNQILKFRFNLFSIILLLFGSLVTYHQTASDSGPNFLAKLFNLKVYIIYFYPYIPRV